MLSVGAIHPPFTVGVPAVGTVTVGAFGVFCGLVVGGATSVCCVVAFAAEKAVAAYPPSDYFENNKRGQHERFIGTVFHSGSPPPSSIPGSSRKFWALALRGYQSLL